MRKLNVPLEPAFPFFESIAAAKYGARKLRLQTMKAQMRQLYDNYLPSVRTLTAMQPASLTTNEADDLRHCYTASTSPLEELKAYINSHIKSTDAVAAAICQYCGLTHSPESFDHYLPKEIFPEFSTHAHNLVPSCERCNCLKGTKWLGQDGERRILSLYFDALPSRPFLLAEVVVHPRPSAKFWLSANSEDFDGIESVVRNHYDDLDLLNRFNKAASAEFEEKRNEIGGEVRAMGVEAGAAMLCKVATRVARVYSPNYWKAALFHAMAQDEQFIAWCGR